MLINERWANWPLLIFSPPSIEFAINLHLIYWGSLIFIHFLCVSSGFLFCCREGKHGTKQIDQISGRSISYCG
jgi:hypothetical protein